MVKGEGPARLVGKNKKENLKKKRNAGKSEVTSETRKGTRHEGEQRNTTITKQMTEDDTITIDKA